MKARFFWSLMAGAVIGGALVLFEEKFRRAALAATVARSGGHQTVSSIMADGFLGTTLIAAAVVFVLATVFAGRPSRRRATVAPRPRAGAGRR